MWYDRGRTNGGVTMKKFTEWFQVIFTLSWMCLAWGIFACFCDYGRGFDFPEGAYPRWVSYFFLLISVLLLLMIIWFVLHLQRWQYNKIKIFLIFTVIGAFWLLIAILFANIFVDERQAGSVLLGFQSALLVGLCFVLARSKTSLLRQKTFVMWGTVLLFTAVIGCSFWIPGMWGWNLHRLVLQGDLLDYYIGQLSLTFITISVMSVLSEKSVVVYWENIAEAKLIRPLFRSFASYTAYSLAATVASGISVLLNKPLAFVFFFAVNVIVLILLTLTMVDVYFGRDRKKAVRAEFLRRSARFHAMIEYPEDGYVMWKKLSQRERKNLRPEMEYRDIMYNLQHHLHQEIESHNIPFIREVAELYGGNMGCFDFPEGHVVAELLYSAPVDVRPMVADGILCRTEELAQKHAPLNAFAKNVWREDAELWKTVEKRENLSKLTESTSSQEKLERAVLERFTLLLNDVLSASYQPTISSPLVFYGYPSYRAKVFPSRVKRLLSEKCKVMKEEPDLLRSLARVLLYLNNQGGESCGRLTSRCRNLSYLTDCIKCVGLEETEIREWERITSST